MNDSKGKHSLLTISEYSFIKPNNNKGFVYKRIYTQK